MECEVPEVESREVDSRRCRAFVHGLCDGIDDVQQGLQGRAIAAANKSDLALIFLSFNEARALRSQF